MKTRTEITLEMDRWIVVGRTPRKRWCSACALDVEMLTLDDAALFAHVNSRTMFQWVDSGAVHWTETAEGLLLICPNSPKFKQADPCDEVCRAHAEGVG